MWRASSRATSRLPRAGPGEASPNGADVPRLGQAVAWQIASTPSLLVGLPLCLACEGLAHVPAGCCAHLAAQHRIGQQPAYRFDECLAVMGGDKIAGLAVEDHLRDAVDIGDALDQLTARGLPRLRRLRAQGAVADDAGFEALSQSRTLESFWGRECAGFGSRSLLAFSAMPSLRGLGVSLKNVSDEALASLEPTP